MTQRKSCVSIELAVQLIGPPGKYERWSSSASFGSVGLGYDNRPGELTVWRFIRTENPWVGVLTPYIIRLFRYRFELGKLAKYSSRRSDV
ncbi:hypothetical protein PIB30_069608 [Stylosanthes scabra]|uniref:Uncharacterized protein n=1 Tax=Stylosanthes scabra TaxID=79078 RepID=A0ABU6QN81_9FABA|nr:hypothetical protein [Stylosanthes scabra]